MKKYIIITATACFFMFFFLSSGVMARTLTYFDKDGKEWHVGGPDDIPPRYRKEKSIESPQQARSGSERAARSSRPGRGLTRQQSASQAEFDENFYGPPDDAEPLENVVQEDFLGIEIVGQEFFVAFVKKALDLMIKHAPFEFKQVRKDVDMIKQGNRNRTAMYARPFVMVLSMDSAVHIGSLTAGRIARESCYMRLDKERQGFDPGINEAYPDEEKMCLEYGKKVMKETGALPQQVEFLRARDRALVEDD